ncbi:ABC transporter permease [Paenibacillus turpanensis]|uniref:ABC transporter permease n=1 Tax=Paenibacillus turpanensis TaxID=2689078 RepID=UPI001408A68C|nr:ABC transporter permease [Paenibacillus turpanensis]
MSLDINKGMFTPVSKDTDSERIVRPSLSYWQDAWRRLKKNKIAMASLFLIITLGLLAIFGPYMRPFSYSDQSFADANKWPSLVHWFGTDDLGRDLWVRVWMGARYSLFIAIMAATIDLIIGVIYGGISGYRGGKTDNIMMRIVEVLYAIPYLLVVILLMVVMGQGLLTIIIALGSLGWMGMARLVRGQVMQLKEQEFVLAARTLGASNNRILFKHLVPNTLGVIIVNITFTIPSAIFAEAFLSFLGLGIPVPKASLGTLTNDALASLITGHTYQMFIPAAVISLIMLAFNLLGDGLRDALDPRMRK